MTAEREPPAFGGDYLFIEPRLIEDATFLSLRGHPLAAAFHEERAAVYEIDDPEESERRFRALHAAWFRRLRLDEPLHAALQEHPSVRRGTRACLICRAEVLRLQGVDMHVASENACEDPSTARTLVMRLCAGSFTEPDRLLQRLRHELLHIADILDPLFAYRTEVASSGSEPALQRLYAERYRVLWDITVDGRLSRRKQGLGKLEAAHRKEFERVFSMLAEKLDGCYRRFHACERPTHDMLAAFAIAPAGAGSLAATLSASPPTHSSHRATSPRGDDSILSDDPILPAPAGPAPR